MITKDFATHFAQDWIDSWNSHDLDRILSHYADDFEFSSPFIITLMAEPSGTLKGKDNIKAYWTKGLERRPDLRFDLYKVTFGVDTLALHYNSETGRNAVEWFFFAADGRVVKSLAQHDEILITN